MNAVVQDIDPFNKLRVVNQPNSCDIKKIKAERRKTYFPSKFPANMLTLQVIEKQDSDLDSRSNLADIMKSEKTMPF